MPNPNDPDSYDPNEDDDPFASGPTPEQPVDDKVNPFDPDDPFASGPTPAQPGDEDENPIEPMEEGLEGEPPEEEEDPQEEKPPMQPRVTQQQIRLPGAKGPLEVDSIGDYLEDVDWRAIDENARARAQEGRRRQQELEAASQQEEDNKLAQRKVASQNRKDAKADRRARRSESDESIREPAPSIEGMTLEDLEAGQQESSVSGDAQPPQDSQSYYDATFKHDQIFPTGQPATAEHLNSQRMFSLEHEGPKDSLTHGRGQDQEAIHFAMDKATDAIKTSTGEIVHMLEEMSYVLRQHEFKIRHLMEIVDIEEKRSEY